MSIPKLFLHNGKMVYSKRSVLLIIAIYLGAIFFSFIFFNNHTKTKRDKILEEYYSMIFNHSIVRLQELLRRNPYFEKRGDTALKIDKSDILVCSGKKCTKSNLFEFSSVIDKYIPEYVNYRIDINKHLLHRNIKTHNYQIEKSYHIDDHNQISIFVSLDSQFEENLKTQELKPFLVNFISLTIALMMFIILHRFYTTKANNHYFNYYNKLYQENIKTQREAYKKEISDKEKELMRKIWSIEYKNKRDQEINCLFSKKANEMALAIHNGEQNNKFKKEESCSLCSIALYQKNKKNEEISTSKIISDFSDRFSNSEENIRVEISSENQFVEFSSKEFLYQIIYSTINCIIFALKEQLGSEEHIIKCSILKDSSGVANLIFFYNGLPIRNENDLIKLSNTFLQTNANPFCIGVSHMFYILKQENFRCLVGNDKLNYIKFIRSEQTNHKEENNIIRFRK